MLKVGPVVCGLLRGDEERKGKKNKKPRGLEIKGEDYECRGRICAWGKLSSSQSIGITTVQCQQLGMVGFRWLSSLHR